MAWIMLGPGQDTGVVESIIQALRPLGIGVTSVDVNIGMDDTSVVIGGIYMNEVRVVMMGQREYRR